MVKYFRACHNRGLNVITAMRDWKIELLLGKLEPTYAKHASEIERKIRAMNGHLE